MEHELALDPILLIEVLSTLLIVGKTGQTDNLNVDLYDL